MKKIKVLQFSIAASAGGRTQFLLNLWNTIDRTKFIFDFMTFSDSLPFEKELLETGACVFHIKNNPEKNELAFREEFKKILSNGYDIIHIATSYWKNTIIEEMAKDAGIKRIIIHSHSAGINAKNINDKSAVELHERIKENIDCNIATDFVACSESAAEWLYGKSIPKTEVKIIYNGIDTDRFRYNSKLREEYRKEMSIQDSFVLGFVGRFEMVKNIDFIIAVLKKLADANKNVKLVLVGDGSQKERLQTVINEKKLSKFVLFTGMVKDVERYMQVFDVLLMPSIFEGFPISLLEAQCSGLNCLVSSNVSDECAVTDLVCRLDLHREDLWIEKIESFLGGYSRKDYSKVIEKAGFANKDLVSKIERLYLGER